VFLQSTYSQAAYALRGIAPVNEHCVREPHTVPPDVCFHWESSIFWKQMHRSGEKPQGKFRLAARADYLWPTPPKLDAMLGAQSLIGCDGVWGEKRPTHCCRIGDGHLDIKTYAFSVGNRDPCIIVAHNSNISAAFDNYRNMYQHLLSQQTVDFLSRSKARDKVVFQLAYTRMVRMASFTTREVPFDYAYDMYEGFVKLRFYGTKTCDETAGVQAPYQFATVGTCEVGDTRLWNDTHNAHWKLKSREGVVSMAHLHKVEATKITFHATGLMAFAYHGRCSGDFTATHIPFDHCAQIHGQQYVKVARSLARTSNGQDMLPVRVNTFQSLRQCNHDGMPVTSHVFAHGVANDWQTIANDRWFTFIWGTSGAFSITQGHNRHSLETKQHLQCGKCTVITIQDHGFILHFHEDIALQCQQTALGCSHAFVVPCLDSYKTEAQVS